MTKTTSSATVRVKEPMADDSTLTADQFVASRFTRSAQQPIALRSGISESLTQALDAAVIGCTESALAVARSDQRDAVEKVAEALLEEMTFAAEVRALPFRRGERITIVGDSISADGLGWPQVLGAVLAKCDRSDISVVNLANGGHTTSDTLAISDIIVGSRPDWVLQMLGTNDARRHGKRSGERMLSATETRRNLLALAQIIEDETHADLVSITPPAMSQRLFDTKTPRGAAVSWRACDVAEIAEIVRTTGRTVIDLHSSSEEMPSDFFLDDGVHPSFSGQVRLLRTIISALAALDPPLR